MWKVSITLLLALTLPTLQRPVVVQDGLHVRVEDVRSGSGITAENALVREVGVEGMAWRDTGMDVDSRRGTGMNLDLRFDVVGVPIFGDDDDRAASWRRRIPGGPLSCGWPRTARTIAARRSPGGRKFSWRMPG